MKPIGANRPRAFLRPVLVAVAIALGIGAFPQPADAMTPGAVIKESCGQNWIGLASTVLRIENPDNVNDWGVVQVAKHRSDNVYAVVTVKGTQAEWNGERTWMEATIEPLGEFPVGDPGDYLHYASTCDRARGKYRIPAGDCFWYHGYIEDEQESGDPADALYCT